MLSQRHKTLSLLQEKLATKDPLTDSELVWSWCILLFLLVLVYLIFVVCCGQKRVWTSEDKQDSDWEDDDSMDSDKEVVDVDKVRFDV